MKLNISTWLTVFRVMLIPIFVLTFYLPFKWCPIVCIVIFIISAVTDLLDGFLARRWKQITILGAFLDPVADKILVSVSLVLVSEYFHVWWITLPASVIISREIVVSALREWLAEVGKYNSIIVTFISKIKTFMQMFSLMALLWRNNDSITSIGVILLYISTILTFLSMFQYLRTARNFLYLKNK